MIPNINYNITISRAPFTGLKTTLSSGQYSAYNKTASVFLQSLRYICKTEQELIQHMVSCIEHETLHHCIMSITDADAIITIADKRYLTKQEWIVRRITGQPTDFINMASYKLADIQMQKGISKARLIIFSLIILMYVLLGISIVLLFKVLQWML